GAQRAEGVAVGAVVAGLDVPVDGFELGEGLEGGAGFAVNEGEFGVGVGGIVEDQGGVEGVPEGLAAVGFEAVEGAGFCESFGGARAGVGAGDEVLDAGKGGLLACGEDGGNDL